MGDVDFVRVSNYMVLPFIFFLLYFPVLDAKSRSRKINSINTPEELGEETRGKSN
jgi:hypothetical protein